MLNNGSQFNQKAKISSNLILNDGIAEKILIKKTCKKIIAKTIMVLKFDRKNSMRMKSKKQYLKQKQIVFKIIRTKLERLKKL